VASDDARLRMVKQVCVSRGVSVVTLSGYRNFALQVDKTRKQARGRDLELVVGALIRRYVKLGLDRGVLAEIALSVFNVAAPIGP
jgi:hypothetical protein